MQSSLLAQIRPTGTTAVAALTPTIRTEIGRLIICNTTAGSVNFSLYHDDDGTTYSDDTALFKSVAMAANETRVLTADAPGLGISINIGGSFAVQSSVANALNFSIYGSTLNVAPNQSRL